MIARLSNPFFQMASLVMVSYFMVAFGQPSWWIASCPFAATIGYSLFWKALSFFSSSRKRWTVSLFWYASVQMVQISWMTSVAFQSMWLLVFDGILALFLGVLFAGFSQLLWMQRPKGLKILSLLSLSSFWTLLEWGRLHILCGFSFNFAGMSLSAYTNSMQMASIFGVLGLSFWVFFTNLLFLKSVGFEKTWSFCKKTFCLFVFFAVFPFLFGEARIRLLQGSQESSQDVSVAILDTDLLPSEKIPLEGHISSFLSPWKQWQEIVRILPAKTEQPIDILVMPEAVVPFGFDVCVYSLDSVKNIFECLLDPDIARCYPPLWHPYAERKDEQWFVSNAFWMQTIANYYGSELIAGLDYQDKQARKNYNSAFHFAPFESVRDRYDKQILVPLGEYIPFSWCENIAARYGVTSFFSHGKNAKVFFGKVPLAVSICYEETFSHIVRQGKKEGAKLLVSLSNDSWYPFSKLGEQHYDHGKLRAVENGVPLIRSCNGGISVVVGALGETSLQEREARWKREKYRIILQSVKINNYFTLYSFWGNNFIVIISFLFLGFFPYASKRK